MGSLSGILQRLVIAASVVAIASVSTDFQEKILPNKSLTPAASSLGLSNSSLPDQLQEQKTASWVSQISVSKLAHLSFVNRIHVPVPDLKPPNFNPFVTQSACSRLLFSSVASSPHLVSLYQSAELLKAAKPGVYAYDVPSSTSEVLYRWHIIWGKYQC